MKKRYEFDKVDRDIDLYLDGLKVVSKHRGSTGNYYFNIVDDLELKVAEHDPRMPIMATIEDGKLVKVDLKPVWISKASSDKP